jgi:prepilin peptidase CpaA
MAETALTCVLIALLAAAAWRDLATRLIPDAIPAAILAAALLLRGASGIVPLAASLGVGALVFAVLLALAMRGLLGGGDVKLAAAFAVALPPEAAWDFVVATTLAGGVLGIGYIAAARAVPVPADAPAPAPLLRRVLRAEARRIRRRGPLPYAVAIAAGGTAVLLGQAGM